MERVAQWSNTPIVKFGSHIPLLVKVLLASTGDCLEMGMGFNSSLIMHWLCADQGRVLVSYENDHDYFNWPLRAGKFNSPNHYVYEIKDWDEARIQRPWGLAFLDHKPAERRIVDVRRLADWAEYIIIHDSEGRNDQYFHYQEIYPLFRYQFNYNKFEPHTTVLSNFRSLENLR